MRNSASGPSEGEVGQTRRIAIRHVGPPYGVVEGRTESSGPRNLLSPEAEESTPSALIRFTGTSTVIAAAASDERAFERERSLESMRGREWTFWQSLCDKRI